MTPSPTHRPRIVVAALVTALACSKPPVPSGSNDTAPPFSGVWTSDGYGWVFVASGDTLQSYEVTATTCVKTDIGIGRPRSDPVSYLVDGSVFSVYETAMPDEKRLQAHGAASYVTLRRLPGLPAVCATPTPDTPQANFDVFANSFAEHYILFDQKGVDWAALTAKHRATITDSTTPAQLFDILRSMVAPFEDAHIRIAAESIDKSFHAFRKGTERLITGNARDFREKQMPAILGVTNTLLRAPIASFCNDRIHYAWATDSIGYLRILSESGYTEEGGFDAGLVALEATLDTVFSNPRLKGLILDFRINFGGADPYGLALANRLATTEYLAYSKEARNDPMDRTKWTPGQPSMVRPSNRPGFKGPVVQLISPLTISAGETTTQALMGRVPNVIRLGEHTQGVFSDVLGRRMPNGWSFGLQNEVFRTKDGATFDGPGIPPDEAVPVFAASDLAAGRDPGLTRAISILRSVPPTPH